MEIPGFYYDPEKKRYFKIQNDRSVPSSHAHSKANVVRKKEESEHQQRQSEWLKTLDQTSLLDTLRNRETNGGKGGMYQRSIWSQRLKHPKKTSTISKISVDDFMIHPLLDLGFLCWQNILYYTPLTYTPRYFNKPCKYKLADDPIGIREVSDISSVNIEHSHSATTIITTGFGNRSNAGSIQVYIMKDSDVRDFFLSPTINFRYRLTKARSSVLTGASVCLPSGEILIAAGADQGRITTVSNWALSPHVQHLKLKSKSDVFSQLWDGEGKHLLCGTRNGDIHGIDLRASQSQLVQSSQKSAVCSIKYTSSSNTRHLDRIICSYMDGDVCVYDLRQTAKPCLTLSSCRNSHTRLVFDILKDSEMVVACGEDNELTFWNLRSGERKRTPAGIKKLNETGPAAAATKAFLKPQQAVPRLPGQSSRPRQSRNQAQWRQKEDPLRGSSVRPNTENTSLISAKFVMSESTAISPFQRLFSLVEDITQHGASKSILLIGQRGSGKTHAIDRIIGHFRKKKTSGPGFLEIRLRGLYHADTRIALKEMAYQLQQTINDEDLELLDPQAIFTALLHTPPSTESSATQTPSESTQTPQATPHVLIILEDFELFATHGNQILVYTLLDAVKTCGRSLSVIGMTHRIDIMELFEKRVKSRFSHDTIYLSPVLPHLHDEEVKEQLEGVGVTTEKTEFDKYIENQFFRKPEVKEMEKKLLDYEKFSRHLSVRYNTQIEMLSYLNPISKLPPLAEFDNLQHISTKYTFDGLSFIDIAMISVILKSTLAERPVNFTIASEQMTQLITSMNLKNLRTGKEVYMKVFEKLLRMEWIGPEDERGAFSMHYGFVKLNVPVRDIADGLRKGKDLDVLMKWLDVVVD
ncbi:origin recognition complex subunit 4 [Phlyctochytrium planicorne]|nr:origin recognition complex subunit 4 [Phlyctochytrium planicorne]